MMKTITFSILMFLLVSSIKAQDKMEEASNFAADYICNCVNKVYSGVEPEIRELILKIYLLPQEKQTEFILSLSKEQQTKVVTQSLIMADETKAIEMDDCSKNMVAEIEKKFKNIDNAYFSEEKLLGDMLNRLKSKKKCEFAYTLMKIGMEQQNQEDINVEENNEGEERK
jgi:hypothetical protein